MARKNETETKQTKRPVESHAHRDKDRLNNPPAGLVTPQTDPPYRIKYGSNFQPFVNKRDVKDGKDEDLTAEPCQARIVH